MDTKNNPKLTTAHQVSWPNWDVWTCSEPRPADFRVSPCRVGGSVKPRSELQWLDLCEVDWKYRDNYDPLYMTTHIIMAI